MSRAEQIVIIGAGDHGRGTLEILLAVGEHGKPCEVLGFVDDAPSKQGKTVAGVPVLGGIEWLIANHHDSFRYVIGIADCRVTVLLEPSPL